MTNAIYPIHRGINRPMLFKGLCGQYILYGAVLAIDDLILFAAMIEAQIQNIS